MQPRSSAVWWTPRRVVERVKAFGDTEEKERYNRRVDYYAQPDDEVIVRCAIDHADYDDLKSFLKAQSIVAELSFNAYTTDSMPDPTAIVRAIVHNNIIIHLTKEAVALGDTVAKAAAGYAVKAWIDSRNARKQKEIESGTEEPLLFDQYGHNIKVKKKK